LTVLVFCLIISSRWQLAIHICMFQSYWI